MTDSQNFGFAKLVPGFDFLQNLAKGTTDALPQMPGPSSWVAPTLNVEEIDKRIQELRAVHFWLEQNTRALSATIQALEVQKMTLATLQGMNCSMADLAQAMQAHVVTPTAWSAGAPAPAPQSDTTPEPAAKPSRKTASTSRTNPSAGPAGVVDPMQWWGSLTQQFQHIAATAMQDATQKAAETAHDMAGNAQAAAASVKPRAAAKKAARKSASRSPAPARRGARGAGG